MSDNNNVTFPVITGNNDPSSVMDQSIRKGIPALPVIDPRYPPQAQQPTTVQRPLVGTPAPQVAAVNPRVSSSPQQQPPQQVQAPNANPGTWAPILGAVGNFFNHIPILNMISEPFMNDATKNAVKGYADYVGKYGQAADAAKRRGQKLPPRQGLMDYLRDRNLYSDFMQDPRNRRAGWLDQAHLYHEQGNQEAARVSLQLAGDTEDQIRQKVAQWGIHHFMRNNGPELNKLLAEHDYTGAMDLLKKGGPDLQQIMGPPILKEQDAWTQGQRSLAGKAVSNAFTLQGKQIQQEAENQRAHEANQTKLRMERETNASREKLAQIRSQLKKVTGNSPKAQAQRKGLETGAYKALAPLFNPVSARDMTSGLAQAEATASDLQKPVSEVLSHVGVHYESSDNTLRIPNGIYGTAIFPVSNLPKDMQDKVKQWYSAQPQPTVNQAPGPGTSPTTNSPAVSSPTPTTSKVSGTPPLPGASTNTQKSAVTQTGVPPINPPSTKTSSTPAPSNDKGTFEKHVTSNFGKAIRKNGKQLIPFKSKTLTKDQKQQLMKFLQDHDHKRRYKLDSTGQYIEVVK